MGPSAPLSPSTAPPRRPGGALHRGLVWLLRNDPEWLVEILERQREVPADHRVQLAPTEVWPIHVDKRVRELRADLVMRLWPDGIPPKVTLEIIRRAGAFGVIVEVQCEIEADKPERWPEYGIAYVPVVGQQIVLVVLALDRSVIRWVRKILRTLRSTVKIILLTPRKIPRSPQVDPETQPHRALLEAMVHVRDRRQLPLLVRALRALEHVEATEHVIYREMLVSRIEEPLIMAAYEQLQANETYDDYVLDRRELKSFLYVRGHRAGVEAGELAGRAQAVIDLLHDRGLPTTPELEASLLGCRDPLRLRRALVRAATIDHADALLAD